MVWSKHTKTCSFVLEGKSFTFRAKYKEVLLSEKAQCDDWRHLFSEARAVSDEAQFKKDWMYFRAFGSLGTVMWGCFWVRKVSLPVTEAVVQEGHCLPFHSFLKPPDTKYHGA